MSTQMKRKIKATQTCAFMAQQAHPVLKKNGTKYGISRLKSGYRKYGRTNALPFSVPFPFTPSRFRPRFRLSRKIENGREKMVYGCGRNRIHPVRFHPWIQVRPVIDLVD
jgi:hypothetical protein